MPDGERRRIIFTGSVGSARGSFEGQASQEVSRQGREITTRVGLRGTSFLDFTRGEGLSSFSLAPAPGANLRGGTLEGANQGLPVGRAWARFSGNASQFERADTETNEVRESITRLRGSSAMGVDKVGGVGQIVLAPAPGVGMSITMGGMR